MTMIVHLMMIAIPAASQIQQHDDIKSDNRLPLKIVIFKSMLSGLDEDRAKSATTPLISLLAENLEYPIDLEFSQGSELSDLKDLGDALKNSEIHVGVVWGTEYAWLKKQPEKHADSRLQTLVMINVAGEEPASTIHSRLYVRNDSGIKNLADLSGKRLAEFEGATLDDLIFRHELSGTGMISTGNVFRTPKDALFALLKKRDVDCVIVSGSTFNNFEMAYPSAAKSLTPIEFSKLSPMAALIGTQSKLNKLKDDLWINLQRELQSAHNTNKGNEMMKFWRFSRFLNPSDEYERTLSDAMKNNSMENFLKANSGE